MDTASNEDTNGAPEKATPPARAKGGTHIDRAAVLEALPEAVREQGLWPIIVGAVVLVGLLLYTAFGPQPPRHEQKAKSSSSGPKVVFKPKPAEADNGAIEEAIKHGENAVAGEGDAGVPAQDEAEKKRQGFVTENKDVIPRESARAPGASVALENPSFETAGGAVPTGWQASGSAGCSGPDGTIAANVPAPDGKRFGYIKAGGVLKQVGLAGLSTRKRYWLQIFRAADGGNVTLTAEFGGDSIGTTKEAGGSFAFSGFDFRPRARDGDLVIKAEGSGTALLDAVTLIQRDSSEIAVRNPSFEGSVPIGPHSDADSPIAGWEHEGTVVVQKANGVGYHDNGLPDGTCFAALNGGACLKQTISGLEVGKWYEIRYLCNGRENNPDGNPRLEVSMGPLTLQDEYVDSVGPFGAFKTYAVEFKASAPEMSLEFRQIAPGDTTAFVDNVSIRPGTGVRE